MYVYFFNVWYELKLKRLNRIKICVYLFSIQHDIKLIFNKIKIYAYLFIILYKIKFKKFNKFEICVCFSRN